VTLPALVGKFLSSNARGRESLRVFVNTSLGEGWEDRTQRVEPQSLLARREDYGPDVEVPAPAACLTAGVDTQDDRFELLVLAWGPGEERWVVDWRRIEGDPKRAETRDALRAALGRRYAHAHGVSLPIHATCIDSGGHRTDDVYDFVLAHQAMRTYATIGRSGLSGKPIVGPPSPRRSGRNPRPVPLYTINVDDAKASILSSLELADKGPGYLHLPLGVDTVDESFVSQLTAEQLVTRHTKEGIAYQVWVQIRAENHALDCSVLALAALRLLRPNLRQMAVALGAHVGAPHQQPGPAPATLTVAPSVAPRSRVTSSRYLSQF
jgi:phage terminase large subunit GpA-like protein